MRLLAAVLCTGMLGLTGAAKGASAERGDYLVNTIMACGSCHTPFGPGGFDQSQALSGRLVEDVPQFKAVAANITPAGAVAAGPMPNWPGPSARVSAPTAA
jgi:mono/diheme cytochrome c family protein